MKTYTVFCVDDDDDETTTWIDTVEAENEEQAGILGEEACADAWGYEGSARTAVRCIGIAEGNVNIIFWED